MKHSAISRSALTLIELLVVIAIISIIVSAIVVASMSALKAAQIKGTRGVMQNIATALNQYKQDFGMYVPTIVDGNPLDPGTAASPAWGATFPVWQALELEGKFTMPAANKLAEVDALGNPTGRFQYIDAWKQPLWYQCPPLSYKDGLPEFGDFSRFRLISGGPDLIIGTVDTDSTFGDDIIVE